MGSLSPPVGLYPAGLCLPSFKTTKEPGVSNRDINGLMNEGAYAWSKVLEQHPIVCSEWMARQDMVEVFPWLNSWRLLMLKVLPRKFSHLLRCLLMNEFVCSMPSVSLSPAPNSPLVSHFPGHLLTNLRDIGKLFECWRKGLILKAEYLVPSPTWTNCCCSLSLEFSLWEKWCWPLSYVGQEARVRTGHGTTDWFQIGKGVCQGSILSPCLFNLYAEYIMRNAGLDEAQAGIKIARRNTNNLRYADDTTLMAESEEELKSPLMKVKEESEKSA